MFRYKASHKKGRLFQEGDSYYESPFRRDYERIIQSHSFQRLQHKTQVLTDHASMDHCRNRMTHSLETASIARTISYKLGLCPELAEAISIAHDLGHPPFGHAGEDALQECMKNYGGFCHNAYGIKLLTLLEKRYARFDGLNLTWEVIDGILKHNGKYTKQDEYIMYYKDIFNLDLNTNPSLEAQVAAISDDIAYNSHDIEDAINAGFFNLDELCEIDLCDSLIKSLNLTNVSSSRACYEFSRKLTAVLINDVLDNTRKNIDMHSIAESGDAECASIIIVSFSDAINAELGRIRSFLFKRFYKHHSVMFINLRSARIVRSLFEMYVGDPICMPTEWQAQIGKFSVQRVVSDYIAGMTNRYALSMYRSFYTPDT